MDWIKFDFEKGTIEFENRTQKGTHIVPDLVEKKLAILEAAGYERFDTRELLEDLKKIGLDIG